jgi:hypothetical protein
VGGALPLVLVAFALEEGLGPALAALALAVTLLLLLPPRPPLSPAAAPPPPPPLLLLTHALLLAEAGLLALPGWLGSRLGAALPLLRTLPALTLGLLLALTLALPALLALGLALLVAQGSLSRE